MLKVFLVFSFVILLNTAPTSAIESLPPPNNGITVSPAYVTVQVGSKQPQASTSIGIRNNYNVPITVTAILNGYDIRNNSLLPTSRPSTSLADVVEFTPAEITIPAQSSKNIAITVNDKASLPPGGQYLSLLLTQTSAGSDSDTPQLALQPAVSATIYVIKEDGAVRSIEADDIKFSGSLFTLPQAVNATFFNNGNVVSIPRGIVTIARPGLPNIVAQSVINSESVPLYPKQTTTLQSRFVGFGKPILPTRFIATLEYRPDGQDASKTLSSTIWYVPVSTFIGLAVIVILSSLLINHRTRKIIIKYIYIPKKSKRKPYIPPVISEPTNLAKPNDSNPTKKSRKIPIS